MFNIIADIIRPADLIGGAGPSPGAPAILMENSGYILLEDGTSHILLE